MAVQVLDAQSVTSYWWVLTIRGVLAILFGFAAVFWPGITLLTLLYLFSGYILINGIVDIVHGIASIRYRNTWIFTLLLGFAQVGIGVYLLRHPGVSFATFILLIGFGLIVRGVFEAVGTFNDENTAGMKFLNIIGAILAILAGIIVLFQPASGGVAFVWVLGLYALIVGPLLIAASLEIKHLHNRAL